MPKLMELNYKIGIKGKSRNVGALLKHQLLNSL